MKSLLALLCAAAVGLAACSSGAVTRGLTSVAVKGALKDNDVNYTGEIICRGSQLPVTCTSTATDGRPISATLSRSGGDCVLTVTVGGTQISRKKADCL
jgi:hypothetical protein